MSSGPADEPPVARHAEPLSTDHLPPEESIEPSEIEERLDEDPEEQKNYTETHDAEESLENGS